MSEFDVNRKFERAFEKIDTLSDEIRDIQLGKVGAQAQADGTETLLNELKTTVWGNQSGHVGLKDKIAEIASEQARIKSFINRVIAILTTLFTGAIGWLCSKIS